MRKGLDVNAFDILKQLAARHAVVQIIVVDDKHVVEYRHSNGVMQSHYAPTLEEALAIAAKWEGFSHEKTGVVSVGDNHRLCNICEEYCTRCGKAGNWLLGPCVS